MLFQPHQTDEIDEIDQTDLSREMPFSYLIGTKQTRETRSTRIMTSEDVTPEAFQLKADCRNVLHGRPPFLGLALWSVVNYSMGAYFTGTRQTGGADQSIV